MLRGSTEETQEKAIRYFQQAIEKRPRVCQTLLSFGVGARKLGAGVEPSTRPHAKGPGICVKGTVAGHSCY
jgi:hypothetical protein